MSAPPPAADDVARALLASPTEPATLALARDAASGDVVAALLKQREARGEARTLAIKVTMALLERLMDADAAVAGRMMAELYGPASDALLHEVCDAIDLWFDACRDPALARALRREAASAREGRRKKRFEGWAKSVEKNVAP